MQLTEEHIIELLIKKGIDTIIIGKNVGWKQEVEMGTPNNQHFVCIPHARFIEMLTYKAEPVGIRVIVTEESYTSKASFLDEDAIPVYNPEREEEPHFSGRRIKRGLYRASGKRHINADVNGAYNILRKAVPTAFAQGIKGVVVRPVRMSVFVSTAAAVSAETIERSRKAQKGI